LLIAAAETALRKGNRPRQSPRPVPLSTLVPASRLESDIRS
jgi:hypothetical protein